MISKKNYYLLILSFLFFSFNVISSTTSLEKFKKLVPSTSDASNKNKLAMDLTQLTINFVKMSVDKKEMDAYRAGLISIFNNLIDLFRNNKLDVKKDSNVISKINLLIGRVEGKRNLPGFFDKSLEDAINQLRGDLSGVRHAVAPIRVPAGPTQKQLDDLKQDLQNEKIKSANLDADKKKAEDAKKKIEDEKKQIEEDLKKAQDDLSVAKNKFNADKKSLEAEKTKLEEDKKKVEDQLKNKDNELNKAKNDLLVAQNKFDADKKALEVEKTKAEEDKKKVEDELRAKQDEFNKKLEDKEKQVEVLKDKQERTEEDLKKLQDNLEEEKKKLQAVEDVKKENKELKEEVQKEKEESKKLTDELKETRDKLNIDVKEAERIFKQKKLKLNTDLDSLRIAFDNIQKEKEALENKSKDLLAKLDETKNKLTDQDKLNQTVEDLRSQISSKDEEIKKSEENINKLTENIEDSRKEFDSKLEEVNKIKDDLKKELEKYKEQQNDLTKSYIGIEDKYKKDIEGANDKIKALENNLEKLDEVEIPKKDQLIKENFEKLKKISKKVKLKKDLIKEKANLFKLQAIQLLEQSARAPITPEEKMQKADAADDLIDKQADILESGNELRDISNTITKIYESKRNEQQQELTKLKEDILKANKDLTQSKIDLSQSQVESKGLEVFREKNKKLEEEIAEYKERQKTFDALESEVKRLKKENQIRDENQRDLQQNAQKFATENAKLKSKIKEFNKKFDDQRKTFQQTLNKQNKNFVQTRNDLIKQNKELQAKLQDQQKLDEKFEQLKKNIDSKNEELDLIKAALKDYVSSDAIDAILQKKSKEIKGLQARRIYTGNRVSAALKNMMSKQNKNREDGWNELARIMLGFAKLDKGAKGVSKVVPLPKQYELNFKPKNINSVSSCAYLSDVIDSANRMFKMNLIPVTFATKEKGKLTSSSFGDNFINPLLSNIRNCLNTLSQQSKDNLAKKLKLFFEKGKAIISAEEEEGKVLGTEIVPIKEFISIKNRDVLLDIGVISQKEFEYNFDKLFEKFKEYVSQLSKLRDKVSYENTIRSIKNSSDKRKSYNILVKQMVQLHSQIKKDPNKQQQTKVDWKKEVLKDIKNTNIKNIIENYSINLGQDTGTKKTFDFKKDQVVEGVIKFPTNLKVNILPCLSQKKSEDDHTNYCGYYALYNANTLLSNKYEDLLNRELFTEFFKTTLTLSVKNFTSRAPNYDNLSENELQRLIKELKIKTSVVPLKSFFLYMANMDFGMTVFFEDAGSVDNLDKFKDKKINQLNFIAGLAYSGGHWIAMSILRTGDDIAINISDSLHFVGWYNQDLIISRIIPFYFAALGQWDNNIWKKFIELNGLEDKSEFKSLF